MEPRLASCKSGPMCVFGGVPGPERLPRGPAVVSFWDAALFLAPGAKQKTPTNTLLDLVDVGRGANHLNLSS